MNNINKLENKLTNEYNKFKEKTLEKSKEDIFNSAYEITSKEEIKEMLQMIELYEKEITALIDQDDVLNEFYHDWLNDDSSLGESMENSILNSITTVTRYNDKNNNKERD